jgi:ariadne-1
MDVDTFGDDFKVMKAQRKPYEIDYLALSQNDVEKLMQQDVDHISGIFGVDVSIQFASSLSLSTYAVL